MRDDLRSAARSLRSSASVTITALVLLTLGIGATTAIFSVVDAVVLRGLPFDEHDRLVAVGERGARPLWAAGNTRDPDALSSVAPQNYADWAAQQQVFESMAAIASGWLTLREPGAEPESLVPQRVTAQFFDVLRVRPVLGRAFTAANEVEGRHRVAVLSDGLWRRRFGASASVIGKTIPLVDVEGGSGAYEIVGVMPRGFSYPVGASRATDLWVPYVVPSDQRVRDPGRRSNYLQAIARLKTGVSLQQAQAGMDQIAARLQKTYPSWNKDNRIGVRPLIDHLVGSRIRSWMLMLLGAVGIVLLIACANVANLLLARASAREHELSIRAALGAGRWRLIRQSLIESLVLSAAGTLCAVVAGVWAVQVLKHSMPESVPRVSTIALNLRVLAAAAALALVTAIVSGVAPAVQFSKPDLADALKDTARTTAGAARRRLRSALVVVEVALAVVLVFGAVLFIASFTSLMRVDLGFTPEHILTAQVSPQFQLRSSVEHPTDRGPALVEIVDRIGRVPGVLHAAMVAGGMPLGGSFSSSTMWIPGDPTPHQIDLRRVTPEFHQALGIPLRRGRLFAATDRRGAPGVVILNQSAAKQYFAGQDPIGREVSLDGGTRTIVGIVGDVHQVSLELEPRAETYVPMDQSLALGGELIVRTTADPYEVVPAVRAAVFAVLPDVPLRNVQKMEEIVRSATAQRRLNMLLLGLFGWLGLTISAVGVYGVTAYNVSQRTREIGVRVALGATRTDVIRMVVVNAAVLIGFGLALGAAAAWYLGGVARAFLFNVQPTDPRAFAAALLLLAFSGLAASIIPARRAAAVDPMLALRR